MVYNIYIIINCINNYYCDERQTVVEGYAYDDDD